MSLPFSTVEIRWFFEGKIPSPVLGWFDQVTASAEAQPAREDFYLCLADSDSLGIKLREGKIEIKQRHGDPEVARLANNVVGVVERWRKWSYVLAEAEAALANIDRPAGAWIGVRKERQLQKYEIINHFEVKPAAQDAAIKHGCEVELAQITINHRTWWSLCFEAYGHESQLRETLEMVVGKWFLTEPPVGLEQKQSFGYARLLQNHC